MKWTKMLSEYSRRCLINSSDKLVVINSIAQEMLKSLPDIYIHFAGKVTLLLVGHPPKSATSLISHHLTLNYYNFLMPELLYNPIQSHYLQIIHCLLL